MYLKVFLTPYAKDPFIWDTFEASVTHEQDKQNGVNLKVQQNSVC